MEEGLDKTEGGVVISVPQTHKYTHNYKPKHMCTIVHAVYTANTLSCMQLAIE